ncbi:MAG TPA: flagellar export protein FliJ [Caldithrix abyssi]|uniref:Flagellar FliJ protein n=1 Tax=Caldithrix abyssi TaxID=187145 RepID=A0A7V5PQH8_CALAY|nr:flagellar export protein FliJ [Caldithrix abyssi]
MAKAFRFPLQKVLEIRKHKEDQKAIELGQARHELFKEQQNLERLNRQKENLFASVDEQKIKKMDVVNLQVTESYLVDLNEKIKSQKITIKNKQQLVDEKRQELLKVSQEKKIVEKLKERQWQAHKKDVRKELNKLEDEVAIRVTQKGK